ncbi:class I SAM-dependent methyltransferase [uncultured Polaribacter sp.]|uniref:class I SAM-dependent methyltransferase n=1 Tax=uncultured Polaribacter sp. TaxID=174711 RepID=UPI0026206687|nr:class I SAM-dependent methyltransferase [uncultured Polaribacter sp.]
MEHEKELYKNLKPFLVCKDFTVSQTDFKIGLNEEYQLLATTPVPENLQDFYKSEDYISHTDSNKSVFDKVYQFVRNYTLKQKLNLLNSFQTEAKTVLDVGAGTGDFLQFCNANQWSVSGIEPSDNARAIANKKSIVLKENLNDLADEKFDVITLWHVLEHVENLADYIKNLKVLLKPNGRIVIAVPNFKSYDAKLYKEYWAAFDVPRHLWHFSQNSIHKLFGTIHMEVEKTLPMKFDAYYVSLLSEKYKTGKMNPIKAFYNGFISNRKAKQTSEYSSLIYVIKNI